MNDLYSLHDVIRGNVENLLMGVHTSIPARVESYNSTKQTCVVRIAVKRPTHNGDNIPAGIYHDIPVQFPAAGRWVIAGPLEAGDIVLLVIPHYGTKEFMSGDRGREGDAEYVTRHDMNDAIALPGLFTRNSITRKAAHKDKFHIAHGDSSVILVNEDDVTVQVGSTILKVSATGVDITGNLTVNGNIVAIGNVSAVNLFATGDLAVVNVTATGIVQGATVQTPTVGLATHTHTFVDTGSGAVGASVTAIGLG